MYKCKYCDKKFKNRSKFGGHVSGHVRSGNVKKKSNQDRCNKRLHCKFCNQLFKNGRLRHSHERYFHSPWESIKKDSTRRTRLVQEQGHHCSVCKLTEWQNKPIPIELDHIDGNPENNTKENCRLICPNCHAQTPTYKGRNVGKIINSKRKNIMAKYNGNYR